MPEKCSGKNVPVFQCSSVPVPKTASPEKKSRIFSRESNVDFWPAHRHTGTEFSWKILGQKKYVVRYNYMMTENTNILLGKIDCQDRFYQIEKKGRYKVCIPENQSEIICPNMNCVMQVLQKHGRSFSIHDCYNHVATNRARANRNIKRLQGATIHKIVAPPSPAGEQN